MLTSQDLERAGQHLVEPEGIQGVERKIANPVQPDRGCTHAAGSQVSQLLRCRAPILV